MSGLEISMSKNDLPWWHPHQWYAWICRVAPDNRGECVHVSVGYTAPAALDRALRACRKRGDATPSIYWSDSTPRGTR